MIRIIIKTLMRVEKFTDKLLKIMDAGFKKLFIIYKHRKRSFEINILFSFFLSTLKKSKHFL